MSSGNQTLDYKISKTQESIQKLDKHLKLKTCPKSLHYTARANIAPDEIFTKEIKAIKQRAEQDHVSALKRFHQRRLDSHATKLKKAKATKARSNNIVFSQKESNSPSATSENIVNNNNVKIEHLQKEIADLKDLLCTHLLKDNKNVESYYSVFTEKPASISIPTKRQRLNKNIRRKQRRNSMTQRRIAKQRESNEKYIKNLSDATLTDNQVSVISKGLKFIPTPVTNENNIRRQLLRDFEHFARRMRLQFIFHGQDKEPHPFHVKSNWIPPVQSSVALESYLENVKLALAEVKITKPKYNLSYHEHKAVQELKNNTAINIKRADKGSTTVLLNRSEKIQEAQVQLNNRDHYKPLAKPMVEDTLLRVNEIVTQLHQGKHIDDMTKKWLSQTPHPPRIPIFYTLTKIHKPKPVGRPIISGCSGPTERISSFVDRLLQPIAIK